MDPIWEEAVSGCEDDLEVLLKRSLTDYPREWKPNLAAMEENEIRIHGNPNP